MGDRRDDPWLLVGAISFATQRTPEIDRMATLIATAIAIVRGFLAIWRFDQDEF